MSSYDQASAAQEEQRNRSRLAREDDQPSRLRDTPDPHQFNTELSPSKMARLNIIFPRQFSIIYRLVEF